MLGMDSIKIYRCVCVCVCPSHFLSTRLYRSDPTVDSLKNADLRKNVSFGGLDDE